MKYTKILIIMLILILMLFSGCITVPENKSTGRVNTSLNVTTPIPTPIQSKYVSRYVDNQGNLHEVTDYTSQGGSKIDKIIDTDISNQKGETLQDKINKTNAIEQDKVSKQNIIDSGIVGKWKLETSNVYMIYTFKEDGTVIVEHSIYGKYYYTYIISGNSVTFVAKDVGIGGMFSGTHTYRFEDSNNLILDGLAFERTW